MILAYPIPDHLALRKIPSQVRTQRLINKLLDTTLMLMQKQALATISTNLVADTSTVDIASLYRFFPNKESLIYCVIGRSLTADYSLLTSFAPDDQGIAPYKLFSTLSDVFTSHSESRAVYWSLLELAEKDEAFSLLLEWYRQMVLEWILGKMRFYGSVWPDDVLEDLANYFFTTLVPMNSAIVQARGNKFSGLVTWQRHAFDYLLDLAINEKTPPST